MNLAPDSYMSLEYYKWDLLWYNSLIIVILKSKFLDNNGTTKKISKKY